MSMAQARRCSTLTSAKKYIYLEMELQKNKVNQNLHTGWVIANHILVSFHVAFISSLLVISAGLYGKSVLGFVFTSYETIISFLFMFLTFHTGIAIHEMGHYLRAVKVNALKEHLLAKAQDRMKAGFIGKALWLIEMYMKIPYGKFPGVKKEGLTYYPESPFNLSVAAAGPLASRWLALTMLPIAIILLILGLTRDYTWAVYVGRVCLGMGLVGFLDFLLADPGKYREFMRREATAKEKAAQIVVEKDSWFKQVQQVKETMMTKRMQEIVLEQHEKLRAPWQYRNCGMGGRHTEKEYPESNISMQEMMFLPLCAKDYEEAQMITVALQTRLKEIMEKAEGARVMGIGLEGGLAPYVAKEPQDQVPEQRMWRMAVQAIRDIGYTPGKDICLAFDPALSELSNAYREEFNQKDSVGMYYFWRGEEKVVMSRDQLVDLYKKAVSELPIVSLEDAFAEDDHEGWRLLMKELGEKVFIIGDDLVTTKDSTIEECADKGLINTALIKANQIGSLSETMIAMLVALGKRLDLVVSHRSKSPNDDMEAQIALSVNALGLKAGGGANTERLFKYGSVTKIMKEMAKSVAASADKKEQSEIANLINALVITDVIAYEEPTNAGIPSVGIDLYAGIPGSKTYRKILKFTGSTPLGTSAGVGEAIHLIDSTIERSHVVDKHPDLFSSQPDKTYKFKKGTSQADINAKSDVELEKLWQSVQRYDGKGCQNAVNNVLQYIAPAFIGKKVAEFKSIASIDKQLFRLEQDLATKRGKMSQNPSADETIEVMQRKGNLGMNAILSMSLAMGRLIAHVQGKELWQLLRDEMKEVVAKAIEKNGGLNLLKDAVNQQTLKTIQDKVKSNELWPTLKSELSFEELLRCLQKIEEKARKDNKKLYQILRAELPIYSG